MSVKSRVCLFGTSANPPTGMGGHAGIIHYLASLTYEDNTTANSTKKRFDEIRVLPVYRHMFDEKRDNQASYDDRLAMCKLAFQHIENAVVSDDERKCFDWVAKKKGITSEQGKRDLRVGTADLLDMLIEENPSIELTFALGADTFMDLTRWKWRRSKDVIQLLKGRMVVFLRKMHEDANSENLITVQELRERVDDISSDFPCLKCNASFEKVPNLSSVSSSLVRDSLDEEYIQNEIGDRVLSYIKHNKLYRY